jgi:predicted ester cyclase
VTPEANKRLARRALAEIYERGELAAADELIHPDFVNHEPSHPDLPTGPESVKQTARSLLDAFGDELRFDVEDAIAEGDKVVLRVTMRGRHVAPLMGSAPTGRAFAMRQVHIWRIADGKLIEHWGSRDDLGLLVQLGVVRLDAP